jgi:septal ring factor EnvC (AmiA/AmiB activator)
MENKENKEKKSITVPLAWLLSTATLIIVSFIGFTWKQNDKVNALQHKIEHFEYKFNNIENNTKNINSEMIEIRRDIVEIRLELARKQSNGRSRNN